MSEWTPWPGKRAFTSDRLLRVRFRNGRISTQALAASKWHGAWDRGPDWAFDIVAVRVEG